MRPSICTAAPGARLHLFGADPDLVANAPAAQRLDLYPPPAEIPLPVISLTNFHYFQRDAARLSRFDIYMRSKS